MEEEKAKIQRKKKINLNPIHKVREERKTGVEEKCD